MSSSRWILCGAVCGALGVLLGAFGAHGLPGILERLGRAGADLPRRQQLYETAVRYQMYHATLLVVVGLLMRGRQTLALQTAGWSLLVGTTIFSGLIYVLAVGDPSLRWLGRVVPLGGVLMIAGWAALAWASFESGR